MRVLCCVVCVVHGRQLASQEQSNKRSRQALKERLRALLTTFKTAMLPRADGEAKLLGWVGVCVCVCLGGENAARNPVHHPVLRRSAVCLAQRLSSSELRCASSSTSIGTVT